MLQMTYYRGGGGGGGVEKKYRRHLRRFIVVMCCKKTPLFSQGHYVRFCLVGQGKHFFYNDALSHFGETNKLDIGRGYDSWSRGGGGGGESP